MASSLPPSAPTATPPPGEKWEVDFTTTVSLRAGQEWTSDAFSIGPDEVAALRCDSGARFYAGLFPQSLYENARRRSPLFFPFPRGSDRTTYDQAVAPKAATTYRIVLRIGAFAPPGRVRVTLWMARPVLYNLPPPVAPSQDIGIEEARRRTARHVAIAGGAVVAAIVIWLAAFDVWLYFNRSLSLFDDTLNAEATSVLAVVAVIAGLVAAWRELIVRPRAPPE